MPPNLMSLLELELGGFASLSVGSFAVSAYAGFVNVIAVEIVGIIMAIFSGGAYTVMQVDRYDKGVKGYG